MALKALGMSVAFDPQSADFSAMHEGTDNVYISTVKHKTFVEVNEEGTEAAAVTSVGMGTTSIREQPERFNMVVDRPFFVAIRDNSTGTVLFMGTIVQP
jgi:serpin B